MDIEIGAISPNSIFKFFTQAKNLAAYVGGLPAQYNLLYLLLVIPIFPAISIILTLTKKSQNKLFTLIGSLFCLVVSAITLIASLLDSEIGADVGLFLAIIASIYGLYVVLKKNHLPTKNQFEKRFGTINKILFPKGFFLTLILLVGVIALSFFFIKVVGINLYIILDLPIIRNYIYLDFVLVVIFTIVLISKHSPIIAIIAGACSSLHIVIFNNAPPKAIFESIGTFLVLYFLQLIPFNKKLDLLIRPILLIFLAFAARIILSTIIFNFSLNIGEVISSSIVYSGSVFIIYIAYKLIIRKKKPAESFTEAA